MSWDWKHHELPFLPGYTFRDVTKTDFHRPQTLEYRNGCNVPRPPSVGIGREPLISQQLIQQQVGNLSFEVPDVTYDFLNNKQYEDFVPAHVTLDKKVLRFYAYFEEAISDSPDEKYRVRPVVIYYYLEDDSIIIFEPAVDNSGIPQGLRIKRQRLPKNGRGEHYYLWKDFNVSMDLVAYGVKYRIAQCDAFTKNFLEREGIVLNDPEPIPEDPYIKRRTKPPASFTTPSIFDQLHRYLTLDRKVLRFFGHWDDTDSMYGDIRPVRIHYYLVDNSVEIVEISQPNSGRDPFPVIMNRQRLPKKLKPECDNFPRCVLQVSSQEVQEFFSPRDFQVGKTIMLLGRRFLLCDCDGFTREYYQTNHPDISLKVVELPKTGELQDKNQEVPPYNGFGSLEDSLQNCYALVPEPPKKDLMKLLENHLKVLRYKAHLISDDPSDEGRQFILSYYLSDDTISIFERPIRNSGIIGGKFLEKTRVPKPGSTADNPVYYSPADLSIGSTVEVFRHSFLLTDADYYVLKYLESISNKIPAETLESVRQALGVRTEQNQSSDENGEIQSVN